MPPANMPPFPLLAFALCTASCGGCFEGEGPVPEALAKSRAAAPAWAEAEPQPRGLAATFDEATAKAAPQPLENAVLVCRATAAGKTDNASTVDLGLAVALPARPRVAVRGQWRVDTAHVLIPFASLQQGSSIRVEAWDEDLIANDPLGAVELPYAGSMPLEASGATFSTSCRALPREVVEAKVGRSIAATTAAITTARGAAVPTPAERGFGRARPELLEPELLLRDAAAFVGWADPGVVAAVASYAAHAKEMDARFAQAVKAAFAAAPTPGTTAKAGALEAKVTSTTCPPSGCELTIELPDPDKLGAGLELTAVKADGREDSLRFEASPSGGRASVAKLDATQAESGLVRVISEGSGRTLQVLLRVR